MGFNRESRETRASSRREGSALLRIRATSGLSGRENTEYEKDAKDGEKDEGAGEDAAGAYPFTCAGRPATWAEASGGRDWRRGRGGTGQSARRGVYRGVDPGQERVCCDWLADG